VADDAPARPVFYRPPVFALAAVVNGRLMVAPLGTPFDLASPAWVDAGPVPDVLEAVAFAPRGG
jgi:hypothetical protein